MLFQRWFRAHMQHGMRQGKDILQPLFPLQEREAAFILRM